MKYAGSITPKTMKLDLNVTMPQNQWIKTYQMSELTRGRGKDVIRNQTTGEYEWGESDNQILTAALYTDMDLEMVKEAGSLYATVSVIIKGMGGYLLPQLLKSVTLESDGNITAEYTSDELQLGEQKFSEIDMDNPASQQQVINFIMMKLMFNTLSADDITAATQGRNYADSPRGLAFWYLKNDLLYVKLNLPSIISLAMQGQGQTVDAHLIAGIADAILKSNPFLLKTLLGVVSESLDNSLLSMIANMDHQSFQMFFSWIKEGIPMQIEKENAMRKILIVVDMQNDFVTGALGSEDAQKILPGVRAKIDAYHKRRCRSDLYQRYPWRELHGDPGGEIPSGGPLCQGDGRLGADPGVRGAEGQPQSPVL